MKPASIRICGLAFLACILFTNASAMQPQPATSASLAHQKLLAQKLEQLGSGTSSLAAARLTDGEIVTGWVAESGPFSFVLVNPQTGERRTLSYQITKRFVGYNLSTGSQVETGADLRAKLARVVRFVAPGMPGQPQLPANNFTSKGAFIIGALVGVIVIILLIKLV